MPALQTPLFLEHAHDSRPVVGIGNGGAQPGSVSAARALCAGKDHVQEGPAGICVDLDKPRAVGSNVEVIAHESARRAVVVAGDRGRPCHDGLKIALLRRDCFNGLYRLTHTAETVVGKKHGHVREEMLTFAAQKPAEIRIAGFTQECSLDCGRIERDARTALVEPLGAVMDVGHRCDMNYETSTRRSVGVSGLFLVTLTRRMGGMSGARVLVGVQFRR